MSGGLAAPGGAFVAATLVLAVASGVLCWLVGRAGVLPNAVSGRSNHARPTSRAGGAVVLCVFAVSAGALVLAGGGPVRSGVLGAVVAAGLIGLADDVRGLGAGVKLAGLGLVAALAAGAAGPVEALPVPGAGWAPLPSPLGYALAALWVLGFVNVFNFMDGLNGMAAGTGLVLLGAAALVTGGQGPLAACMTGALLGFAVPNALGGRPFLGDAGSLSVGTLVAAGAMAPAQGALWVVVAGATPFLADAASTLLARARRGERVWEAHSEHAYQRLHRAGWPHLAVSAAYAGLAAGGAAAGLAARGGPAWQAWGAILGTLAAWALTVRVMAALSLRARR